MVSVTKQPERKEEDISNARKARGARNQGRKEQCEWGRARPSIEGATEKEKEKAAFQPRVLLHLTRIRFQHWNVSGLIPSHSLEV